MFQKSSSISAAKSHPHNSPLVVCTEQRPVRTGVQSGWHRSNAFHSCLIWNETLSYSWNVTFEMKCLFLSCSRMDSQVHRVFYPTRKSPGNSRHFHAGIWQAEGGGEAPVDSFHRRPVLFCVCLTALMTSSYRKRHRREKRPSSNTKMRRAG